MSESEDNPRDLGKFIRDLRRNAQISMRQLARQAGVSNPYLSQIERGLRKPSAEVLAQLASALRVSTPAMYLRAGLLDGQEGHGVLAAIAADPGLTMAQKQSLTQIYETFRRETARNAEAERTASSDLDDAADLDDMSDRGELSDPDASGETDESDEPDEPGSAAPDADGPEASAGPPTAEPTRSDC